MDSEAGQAGSAPRRRRRRRSAKPASEQLGFFGYLRSARFGWLLFAGMALLALAYIAIGYRDVSASGTRIGPLALGMSAEEAGLAMANEPTVHAGSTRQVFQRDGRTITLAFNGRNRLAGITCTEQGAAPLACPALLGVHVGDPADRVIALLGPAELEGAGAATVLEYPSMGIRVQLADSRVISVELREADNERPSIWPVILWRLFP